MFIDMAFGSPIYERLRALGFSNVFETNFGLVHTPDRTKAEAIEADEKMASDTQRRETSWEQEASRRILGPAQEP
jgi:hypothetical protein